MNAAQRNTAIHPLGRFLAILAAVACVAITIVIWSNVSAYQGMWPLPALYFIEIAVLSVISALTFVHGGPSARALMWGAVGVLGAFCILGMFSVGPLYLPIFFIFAAVSVTSSLRDRQHIAAHLAVCLLAAIAQAALMLVVVRLLETGAVF